MGWTRCGAARQDLAEVEKFELGVLSAYLPARLKQPVLVASLLLMVLLVLYLAWRFVQIFA